VLGPLVFLALHARRRHVIACVIGIAALFTLPALLLDSDAYPSSQELRRAAIWIAAGLVSGLSINRLVDQASRARRTTELVLARVPGTVIVIFDRDLRYLAVHGQGSGTDDGLPWDTLVGKTPRELFGTRAGRFEQELLLTIEGTPREFEWRSTSGRRTHLVSTSPWFPTGPDDPAAGMMVVRDITDRVQMERDLDRDRAFLMAVLDNLQDGVVALDSTGSSQLLNNAFRTMLGIDESTSTPQEQWLGSTFRLYDKDDEELGREAMPLHRAFGGEYVPCEAITVRLPDGTRRDLEATAAPIMVYGDSILGAVMTMHDVTAQREAERMKDQFFALVSHELRTPLAAIIGYLELLDEEEHDNLSDDGREFVTVMQRNSQRLMRLIGDLLLAAQVDAGTLTLVRSGVDVADIARHAYDSARVRADERGQVVTLDIHAPHDGLRYVGDRDRLGQVLDNLLTNAIKFTPDDGTITLRACERADAIVLEVADTGRGIPEDEQARLFERFARARSADEDAVQGVGLGLAITKAIVDAHGGQIELESEVGAGTTFRVVLPTAD
jgi:PAS domain S-box-containing protein